MYSILIKNGSTSYVYDTDAETGDVFAGTIEETKARYTELLKSFPSSQLVVVHNTTITSEYTITDVISE